MRRISVMTKEKVNIALTEMVNGAPQIRYAL
jgi:hypothetical protein